MATVLTKTFDSPAPDFAEAVRYAGLPKTAAVPDRLRAVFEELAPALTYKVCYAEYPILRDGDRLDLGFAVVQSADLMTNLADCDRVVLFAATVGLAPDRLAEKYRRLSPEKALYANAVGAERVEALCDAFCADLAAKYAVRPRFSPGYGDLPLALQTAVFHALDCPHKLGVTLTDSLLMTPTKSVTALVGILKNNP